MFCLFLIFNKFELIFKVLNFLLVKNKVIFKENLILFELIQMEYERLKTQFLLTLLNRVRGHFTVHTSPCKQKVKFPAID